MNPRKTGWLFLIAPICALVALSSATAERDTLVGVVEEAEVDDDGNPIAVAIYDRGFGSVLVADNDAGRRLLDHVGLEVEAVGDVSELPEDSDYQYEIVVESFVLLEDDGLQEDPDAAAGGS